MHYRVPKLTDDPRALEYCRSLRGIRQSRGMTQRKMAEFLHVGEFIVRCLERNPHCVSVKMYDYIAVRLGWEPYQKRTDEQEG